MKTYNKSYLPDTIEYKGEVYTKNAFISTARTLNNTSLATISATLRKQGRKAIVVKVLPNNLKGRTDLHGNHYKPTEHIFTNK